MNAETQRSGGWGGCFAGGCTILAIAAFCLVGLLGLCTYLLYREARSYTSDQPLHLEAPPIEQQQFDELQQRLALFKQAYDANQPASLRLKPDEINALIARSPGASEYHGRVLFSIEEGRLCVEGSIPLKEVPGFRDRYLNGKIGFELSIDDGRLSLRPAKIEAGGRALPSAMEQRVREALEQSVSRQMEEKPEVREFIGRVRSMRVGFSEIVIELAPPAAAGAPQ